MMPAISPMTGSRCGATRQICRSLIWPAPVISMTPATSMALEDGFAFFDERLGGFLVVGGLARARVMDRLGVETGFQRHMLGVIDVAFDITERHRRPLAPAPP